MRILLIDNNIMPSCWGSEDLRRVLRNFPGILTVVRRGPHDDFPVEPSGYDSVLISGSLTSILEEAPWIDRMKDLIRFLHSKSIPTLGVCFGHQIIARTFGGMSSVRRTEAPEFGWTSIHQVLASPLLEGIPKNFYSFTSHYDEVSSLPEEFERVAESKDCPIQAFQLKSAPMFGIQFHPEKDLKDGEESYRSQLKKGEQREFLNRRLGPKVYDEKIGIQIFKNALNL